MGYTIPTTEPTAARAGDTWSWKRTLSDYPSTAWTLTYTLYNASAKITITADADGTDHLVSIAIATTGNYTAGRYDWIAHVSDGTDKYQVDAGSMQVLPDLSAAAATYDGRSHARKMLDALNALLEGQATSGQIEIINVSHNGRALQRDKAELIKLRDRYAAAVRQENEAARIARGEKSSRLVQVRFTG